MEHTWSRHFDESSGAEYFVNDVTGESSWDPPPRVHGETPGTALHDESSGFNITNPNHQQAGDASSAEAWQTDFDESSGAYYYTNTVTGEVTWDDHANTTSLAADTGVIEGERHDLNNAHKAHYGEEAQPQSHDTTGEAHGDDEVAWTKLAQAAVEMGFDRANIEAAIAHLRAEEAGAEVCL